MEHDPSLEQALALHKAGRVAEAEDRYRRILERRPGDAPALHLLGVAALQNARPAEAIDLIERAIRAAPRNPAYHNNLGNALRAADRAEEAIAAYRAAIAIDPQFIDAHTNLGASLRAAGRAVDARAVLERARAMRPDDPFVLNNLGNVLDSLGERDEALALYRRAAVLRPAYGEACYNLGRALCARKRHAEAMEWLSRALAAQPDYAEAHAQLGLALKDTGRLDEAVAALREAVRIAQRNAKLRNDLGTALFAAGRLEAAETEYREAAALDPSFGAPLCNLAILGMRAGRDEEAIGLFETSLRVDAGTPGAHNGVGVALAKQGRFEDAAARFRRELDAHPDDADAHTNLGMMLLTLGRFREGWPEYEHRLLKAGAAGPEPRWHGEDLAGKSLLVHPEQGAGDNIQFIRYLRLVRAAQPQATIAYRSPEALRRLFAPLLAAVGVDSAEDGAVADRHTSLLSLPHILRTELGSIPAEVPYLRADPALCAPWRERLALAGGLRIGLVWAGNPEYSMDRDRSLPVDAVAALLESPGTCWISLQKCVSQAHADALLRTGRLIDWTAEIGDFADTAALIEALDLVVSVDTSVAHLAGAMGKPVWLLNRLNTDWRWLAGRADSPWYPTMRIFRQSRSGDWSGVVSEARRALDERVRRRAS